MSPIEVPNPKKSATGVASYTTDFVLRLRK